MNTPLNTLFAILRLKQGPQELPSSWIFTAMVVFVYLAMGVFTGQQLGDNRPASTGLAVSALQFGAVTAMLYARKFPERLPQTLSALAGTGVILGFLSFLLLVQADPGRQQPTLALVWFCVFFWSLAVDGHIYRHAMNISIQQGVLIAVLLLAASYVLVEFAMSPAVNGN